MACTYCTYGMEKELKKVSGIKNINIELEEGLAFVSTPKNQQASKENLMLIF